MKRLLFLIAFWLCTSVLLAQTYTVKLRKYSFPAGNYSGITSLGNNRYAVVSDVEARAGFHVWYLQFDESTGRLLKAEDEGFHGVEYPYDRDAEGIAFCPSRSSLFISGEEDQQVLEHNLDGTLTGEQLAIPQALGRSAIQNNRGFEALCYDAARSLFWTVTESPLKADLHASGSSHSLLRLTSFGLDMQPKGELLYHLSPPQASNHGRDYYHGVAAMASSPDGFLYVLEREARIAPRYLGSCCWCWLFRFQPETGEKLLIDEWHTRFALFNTRFANYEGMCFGPTLQDGRRLLLIISDSQNRHGKAFWHLTDRLRVMVVD